MLCNKTNRQCWSETPTSYYAFYYPIPYWCHWILRQMIVRHLAGAVELCTQCKVYACVLSKMRNSTSSLLLFNLDVCSSDGVRYAEGKAERFVNELQNERNRRSNIHYWILDLGPDVAAFVYDPKFLLLQQGKKLQSCKKEASFVSMTCTKKYLKRSESSQQLYC